MGEVGENILGMKSQMVCKQINDSSGAIRLAQIGVSLDLICFLFFAILSWSEFTDKAMFYVCVTLHETLPSAYVGSFGQFLFPKRLGKRAFLGE